MQLWINASKFAFLIASKATVMSILIMLAFLIPFYNAIRFDVVINYWFIMEVLLSIIVTLTYYFVAYGFGKFTSIISESIYKEPIENFLFVSLILCVASLPILYWKVFTAASWRPHENIFNVNLMLLATFYGIGNCCFLGNYFPKRSVLMKEYLVFSRSGEMLKSGILLIIIAGLIFFLN
jgi:hypothetical protein